MDLSVLGLEKTPENQLIVDAALQWLGDNTTLDVSGENIPPVAKLFILKYSELMGQTAGLKSESLAGMSQSFSGDFNTSLWNIAYSMLLPYLKSNANVTPSRRKWEYGRYH